MWPYGWAHVGDLQGPYDIPKKWKIIDQSKKYWKVEFQWARLTLN